MIILIGIIIAITTIMTVIIVIDNFSNHKNRTIHHNDDIQDDYSDPNALMMIVMVPMITND